MRHSSITHRTWRSTPRAISTSPTPTTAASWKIPRASRFRDVRRRMMPRRCRRRTPLRRRPQPPRRRCARHAGATCTSPTPPTAACAKSPPARFRPSPATVPAHSVATPAPRRPRPSVDRRAWPLMPTAPSTSPTPSIAASARWRPSSSPRSQAPLLRVPQAGRSPRTALNRPGAIAVIAVCDLYIVDTYNSRVREVERGVTDYARWQRCVRVRT